MTAQGEATLPSWLRLGVAVWDMASEREGIVHGIGAPYSLKPPRVVWLLPQGGGLEWETRIEDVRPLPHVDTR